ncbi:hypothetical protein BGZ81_005893 [Podila clonocystis]|nr:hypothetical protein BGZ81_005893 [Podila clonocystis]
MYSAKNPVKNASAPPLRNPQEHTSPPPRNPQANISPTPFPREQEDTYYPQGYQPVPQLETAPSAPPSQHHYDPRLSTLPANYGATNNVPHSASVIPRRKRFKRPKKSSCCYRCCCAFLLIVILTCWYLKDFAYLIDGNCNLSDNAETDTADMWFPADKTLDLYYEIQDGIVGNIVVKEATDWDHEPGKVKVHRTWRASSARLSDAMGDFIQLDEANSKVFAGLHLEFNSAKEKEEALKNNCVRADVEIVYPLGAPGTGRLKVEVTNGDIHVMFDKILKDQPSTFDTLILTTGNGEIQLDNVLVVSNTTLLSANGHVYGSLRTAGAVEAKVLNGPIDIAIDTGIIPGQTAWNPRKLDVKLATLNGPVTLDVLPSFQGHFEMDAIVGRASITASDRIQYKINTSKEVVGWVSVDGKEPLSKLPRMLLYSINGNVKAKIGAPSRN